MSTEKDSNLYFLFELDKDENITKFLGYVVDYEDFIDDRFTLTRVSKKLPDNLWQGRTIYGEEFRNKQLGSAEIFIVPPKPEFADE